jgi:hypothetical protein
LGLPFVGSDRVLLDLEVFFVWGSNLDEISLFLAGIGLQTRSFSRPAIGISRKLIAVNSLFEKPCLDGLGCHPFRDLSGSRGFSSIIGCRLGQYLSAPSPKKRLLPFHFGLPCGSAVVFGSGRSGRPYHTGLLAVHLDLAVSAVVVSFRRAGPTIPSAFVARWCAGSKVETIGGVFQVREDEPAPRVGTRQHSIP